MRMERGAFACFGLISDNAVFAVGKNATIRNSLKQTRHDPAPAPGARFGENKKNEEIYLSVLLPRWAIAREGQLQTT